MGTLHYFFRMVYDAIVPLALGLVVVLCAFDMAKRMTPAEIFQFGRRKIAETVTTIFAAVKTAFPPALGVTLGAATAAVAAFWLFMYYLLGVVYSFVRHPIRYTRAAIARILSRVPGKQH